MILHAYKRILGVTLIELIVAIAIIAILAVLGNSTYTRAKIESKRSDAQTSVTSTEAVVERYLVENNKDNFDSADLTMTQFENYDSTSTTPVLSKGGYYRITITPDSTGYTVSGTATIDNTLTSCSTSGNENKGQCADTNCRVILIKYGARGSIDSTGTVANATTTKCW